jgi:hypothetical protein
MPKKVVGVYIERSCVHVAIEKLVDEKNNETTPFETCTYPYEDHTGGLDFLREVAHTIAAHNVNAAPADHITAIAIASYGPFVRLGSFPPTGEDKQEGYGRLHPRSDPPFREADLPKIFREPFETANRKGKKWEIPYIVVQTDANVFALGEARQHGLKDRDVLVALLMTEGIGGGLVIGQRLHGQPQPGIFGHLHAEAGLIHVAPHRLDPLIKGRPGGQFANNSPGSLAAIPAMLERARRLGYESTAKLDDILENDDEALWPPAAYYISQLCLSCTVLLSPQRIVLGGIMLEREGFIEDIRECFKRLTRSRRNSNYMLEYEYTKDISSFLCAPHQEPLLYRFDGIQHPWPGLLSSLSGCIDLALMAKMIAESLPNRQSRTVGTSFLRKTGSSS